MNKAIINNPKFNKNQEENIMKNQLTISQAIVAAKIQKWIPMQNGAIFKIKYKSTTNPAKEFRAKTGDDVIVKYNEILVRTGCNYGNLQSVIAKGPRVLTEDARKKLEARAEHEFWLIPNKLKYNSNTDKYYLIVYPITSKFHKSSYCHNSTLITGEQYDALVPPSKRRNLTGEKPTMLTINVENIISINGKEVN